jgi:putative serine protease PepD
MSENLDPSPRPAGAQPAGPPPVSPPPHPAGYVPPVPPPPVPPGPHATPAGGFPLPGLPLPGPVTAPPGSPAPRRRARVLAATAVLVVTALASATGGAAIALALDDPPATVASSPVVAAGTATTQLAKVAAAVQPSVVSIAVETGSSSGEGSGVILRADGTILTNNHVVADAASGGTITVTFSDGRTAGASIVGRAPSDDLAVIRASGVSGLTPATLGSDAKLQVGDTVLAIGSPLGLEGSVTAGIVSALDRTITLDTSSEQQSPYGRTSASQSTDVQAIQTDAAINPGNSGGPLVDAQGRVVGITTAIATVGSRTGQSGNIGLGFAIPIGSAERIAGSLADGKQPQHAALGVQVSDAGSSGAKIGQVTSGSAADKAGLKSGDVVTAVDGTLVADASALRAAVRSHAPGDTVTVTYTRDGTSHKVTVALGTASG